MKLNPFPVTGRGQQTSPWSLHQVTLSRLPRLTLSGRDVETWLNPLLGCMLSARERKMRKKNKSDALLFVKDSIGTIIAHSTGIKDTPKRNVFSLRDEKTNNCDTLFFVSNVRYDLAAHSVIVDAYVLPLTHDVMPKIRQTFGSLIFGDDHVGVRVYDGEMEAWKQLIPAFAERCRTWAHGDDCAYLKQQEIPLTQEMESDPLCACGRGKDIEEFMKVAAWQPYAPYVTRIALSPLFAVSYLETIGRDPKAHKCSVCRGKGKPKIMTCKACQKVRYCSVGCQKEDWSRHKPECKP